MRKADKKVSQLDITLSRFFKFIQENLPEWISQFKIINCYTIRDADNVLRLPSTDINRKKRKWYMIDSYCGNKWDSWMAWYGTKKRQELNNGWWDMEPRKL